MEREITPPPPPTSSSTADREDKITPKSEETLNSCCSFEDPTAGDTKLTPPSASRNSTDWLQIQKQQVLRDLEGSVNRYNDCFRSLQQAIAEIKLLSEENLELRSEFLELSALAEENDNLLSTVTAASGSRDLRSEGSSEKRATPKSISIRSSGFLDVKSSTGGSPHGVSDDGTGTSREVPIPHRLLLPLTPQGGAEEAAAEGTGVVEVDVYNQGMARTELCNKWEEMGWCPYGGQCQFAHGMEELRPVIRHPRYKTQMCRMVYGPGGCPYGHRCHFRHALPN